VHGALSKVHNSVNYKLPFLRVIVGAVFFAWSNRAEFLRATAIPTLVLVVLWAVGVSYSDVFPSYFVWLYSLGYGFGFAFLAVTCHRLILIDGADRFKPYQSRPGFRELKFLMWVIGIYVIKSLLEFVTRLPFTINGGDVLVGNDGWVSTGIKHLLSIPALYVFARLSLAFPAVAIDESTSLRWSWVRTRGNGWRIFAVVGLFPWLLSVLIYAVWRENASILEQVVLSILGYIGLAIEIIALSFTYKALANHYATRGQSPAAETLSSSVVGSQDSFHDLAQDGRGRKLDAAVRVVVGLAVVYLFIGSLGSYFVDCTDEVVSRASSPSGAYTARLINRSCKDDKGMQGLILETVRRSTPRTINSYPLSRTMSRQVVVTWTSDKRLVVRYAGSLDLEHVPSMYDDVQIVFENNLGESKGRVSRDMGTE
jgi:hypothetical protein